MGGRYKEVRGGERGWSEKQEGLKWRRSQSTWNIVSPGKLIDGNTKVVQITEPCDIQLNSRDTPRQGVWLPNFVTCHKPSVKPGEETTGEQRGEGKVRRGRIRESRMYSDKGNRRREKKC